MSRRRNNTDRRKRTGAKRQQGDLNNGESTNKGRVVHRHSGKRKKKQPVVFEKLVAIDAVKECSVHAGWMRSLGGLIRCLVHEKTKDGQQAEEDVMREIQQKYVDSDCSVELTKQALLAMLLPPTHPTPTQNEWINVQMVVMDVTERQADSHGLQASDDGQGVVLPVQEQRGEGPARQHQTWKVAVVPPCAVGKPYYLQVKNHSPIPLSCEMTIDGHLAARNVPIPPFSSSYRTIKPDAARYFQSHQWILLPATRTKLPPIPTQIAVSDNVARQSTQQHASPQRYNGIEIPHSQQTARVSWNDFPDPTAYGWKFTGSVEASRVEFYEKQLNIGVALMDFYYSTGTVKTVLNHPTTGMNQLFRKCQVDPETFVKILSNPRHHSGLGYRRREDAPADAFMQPAEAAAAAQEDNHDDTMEDEIDDNTENQENTPIVYPAKNDDYQFDVEGHENRQAAMSKLKPTNQFRAWEEAAKQDWACVHLKFYASVANQKSKRRIMHYQNNNKQKKPPPQLPKVAKISDVKASEHAVLSTKFQPVGDGGPLQPKLSSKVRVKRIAGLNDKATFRAEPLFEYKLYYRAEDPTAPTEEESIASGLESMGLGGHEDMDDDDAIRLHENTSLEEYRQDRLNQLERWHSQHKALDADDAAMQREQCRNGIVGATSLNLVDEYIKIYLDWHQVQEWAAEGSKI